MKTQTKAAALRQHFTTYELSQMPQSIYDSPEALEYVLSTHQSDAVPLRAALEQIADSLDAEEHYHIHRIIERALS